MDRHGAGIANPKNGTEGSGAAAKVLNLPQELLVQDESDCAGRAILLLIHHRVVLLLNRVLSSIGVTDQGQRFRCNL